MIKSMKRHFLAAAGIVMLAVAATVIPVTPATVSAADTEASCTQRGGVWDSTASKCKISISGGVSSSKGEGVSQNLFGTNGIFTTVVNVLLFVIGAVSVIMLIWGGIRYTTSAGNSSAVTSAKNTIMYAIIGLIVAFLAYAIVNWVLGSLGGGGAVEEV